ncbi:hypothetical protein NL676_024148 [Syzygium grande]|nr:hypothetical protein NL676_024148 [Syzygium grande]
MNRDTPPPISALASGHSTHRHVSLVRDQPDLPCCNSIFFWLRFLIAEGLLCVASAEEDSAQSAKDAEAEVLVCGGAEDLKLGRCCLKSLSLSIWTLVFQNNQPEPAMGHGDDAWHPGSGLGNMVLLLNGDVLIIKGRAARTAGWEYYGPTNQLARRTSK